MESLRTFWASRTHFEVLGLGLEASSPRKLACPWLEDSTIFELLKVCGAPENFLEDGFSGDRLKIFSENLCFLRSPEKCF